jgi:adenosine deaminase
VTFWTDSVPKAELHVHLEGTAAPGLVRRLAARHGLALPADLFRPDGRFHWTDFLHFLRAYDGAASAIRTADDYRAVTADYLTRCAQERAIYVEVMVSPDHAAAVGLGYDGLVDGVCAGIAEARDATGIEARAIMVCLRHLDPARATALARQVAAAPHPLVTGFGMAGDEAVGRAADFTPAFRIAADAGLSCTAHAGEVCGADSVRDAIGALPLARIGHGVRAVEDPALLAEIVARGLVLEVCPVSNVATGVYPSLAAHPLRRLVDAGVRVTLNSDDPPYFDTSIGREHAEAARHAGLDRAALLQITRTAIDAAFVDPATRDLLRARIDLAGS